jgi:hypothetical protein
MMTKPVLRVLFIGAADGPRRAAFLLACQANAGLAVTALSYADALGNAARFEAALAAADYVRFESPDRDAASVAALYAAGESGAREAGFQTCDPAEIRRGFAQGWIGMPAQLAFGVSHIVRFAEARAPVSVSAHDVAAAFDKTATLTRLSAENLSVPQYLGAPTGFEALSDLMAASGCTRVFVKLRHGAAAAGMIALARQGAAWRAVTTAQFDPSGNLCATRKVAALTRVHEISRIVDTLAPRGLHVERWAPKLALNGRGVDVRFVCMGGGARAVVRASVHPMTNLHLGGERASPDALIARIGLAAWQRAEASALSAAAVFSSADALGVDVAILNDAHRHIVLEVNVFGTFVKGLGAETAEADAVIRRTRARAA